MSSPKFTTLPKEIRDRVYDFVWDLGQMVSPSAFSPTFTTPPMDDGDRYFDSVCESEHFLSSPESWSNYVLSSQRKFHRFDSFSADVALALLHVNRQVSAEAASVFYGKRTFCIEFFHLISFLQGISLRRHLIKDIEVSDFSSYDKQSCSQTFSLLQSLDGLRSFTIAINSQMLKRVLEHLVSVGIHDLTDRMDVTIYSEHVVCMPSAEDGIPETTSELVVFTNAWKCAKGERQWKSQGLHCWVHFCELAICDLQARPKKIFPAKSVTMIVIV